MYVILALAFLFFVGACIGWGMEWLFRNLVTHKGPRGKYFINPGFCVGPYLPIYGIGLAAMCGICIIINDLWPDGSPVVVILIIGFIMTAIEFIGGLFLLKVLNMRLWDYRKRWGNIMGIICPLFSFIWTAIGAGYYLFIHNIALRWLYWWSDNMWFSFFVGMFWGVFIIDLVFSCKNASIIKTYGKDNDVIVKYDELKALLQRKRYDADEKSRFFNQLGINTKIDFKNIKDDIDEVKGTIENKVDALKSLRHRK